MTEAAFQEARKIMQKANYLRGVITTYEGEVAKWTRIEASHRENFKHSQAEGAQKMLSKAMLKLAEVRKKFVELQFPPNDLVASVNRCKDCGRKIPCEIEYCEGCSIGFQQ